MGKRQNFSSRTIITPDASMDIDMLGVPEVIALQQTIPVRVNKINIKELTRRVRIGGRKLGGALKIEHPDGRMVHLQYCKNREKIVLKAGMIVHRFLQDGDYVVFNRQPTLHKESMMGHRVRIFPGLSFLLPVPDTPPYNADFDGDEMNMFTPQGLGAQSEIKHILGIPHQIIGAKSGKPSMGCVQDTVIGLYMMCQPGCFIRPADFMSLSMRAYHCDECKMSPTPAVMWVSTSGGKRTAHRLYTGYQLASLCIPQNVGLRNNVYDGEAIMLDRRELLASVQDGCLLFGAVTKKTTGASAGGIVDVGLPGVREPERHGDD